MRHLNMKLLERVEGYVKEHQRTTGRSPSYRSIMKELGMSSLNLVKRYLVELEVDGKIVKTSLGKIDLPEKLKSGRSTPVPLVGTIACGQLSTAIEDIEGSYMLPSALFGGGELMMLRANGDSMIDAGIATGDLLVIRRQSSADNGEIVVALVDDETTLKRIFYRDGKIILHPENSKLKDIVLKQCNIQGVLVSCIKMYT